MARFKVIKSETRPPHIIFEVQLLSGVVAVGQPFSLWDTHHRFDFQVAEVHQNGQSASLVCTSDYLRELPPETRFPDMFASKQVDTDDPKIAQSCSHRFHEN
jgi:hypothetical protein